MKINPKPVLLLILVACPKPLVVAGPAVDAVGLLELVRAQAVRACQEEECGEILLLPGPVAGEYAVEEDGHGQR